MKLGKKPYLLLSSQALLNSILVGVLLFFCVSLNAQSKNDSTTPSGQISLGMRNTISAFTDAQSVGMGVGGEWMLRLSRAINTEWFADYIATDIQGMGYRHDAHIGWSVLFYFSQHPLTPKKITTYFLAGNCFDYTNVVSEWPGVQSAERWSFAIPFGFGIHYSVTRHCYFSIVSQYMIHLGTDINTSIVTDDATGYRYMNITKVSGGGLSLEGHWLNSLTVNYQLGKLWGRK